jgi:hypothetical protein
VPDPDEEWGYGPPRCVWAAPTAAFARALEALTDDELADRFDPADMMAKEIYPNIWDRDPDEDDTLAYLMEYVAVRRRFLASAAAEQRPHHRADVGGSRASPTTRENEAEPVT